MGVVGGGEPRFAWRGLMLDVARHFHPVETVLAVVDELAARGLNRLHLHLTDDQGWRIEIESRPRLTELGAATQVGGGLEPSPAYFTKDDYRRIVAYAAERGITVVPEIDLPGHTNAVLVSYPELAPAGVVYHETKPEALPPHPYEGIEVGFSTLSLGLDATYDLVRDVLREIAELTPGEWIHIGGDESLSTDPDEYADFIRWVTAEVVALGKTPIGWHEITRVEGLPDGTIAQYWNFVEPEEPHGSHLAGWVAQGRQVILSPADVAYLDIKPHADHPLGLVWAKGPTSLEDAAGWDPQDIVDAIPGMTPAHVLGVEAPMFTETIATLEDIREMAFPRLDALARIMSEPR
ncbi:MAG: family 20 glycosylhydrolase [Microbacteriaceae bacterium]|nr:family 20 glycosylhydrolase [Microbacteriaceae bacterium]